MPLLPHLRGVLAAALLVALPPHTFAQTDKQKSQAEDAYLAGARSLDRRDYPAAEKRFARALELLPGNGKYLTALALTHEHHLTDLVQQAGRERLEGNPARADALLAQAQALDPHSELIAQHQVPAALPAPPWLSQPPVFAGAIALIPAAGPHTFHLHTDLQEVLRSVASSYGLRVTLDASVPHKSLRFDLEDVPYAQAMPILLQMGHVFAVPLEPTSLLIAADTPENRLNFERQMEETVYMPGFTPEQLTDFGNLVRNVFDVHQAVVGVGSGTLVLRAPEATLTAINRTLDDLLDSGSEVLLDLKLYSVDKTHTRTTGLSVPQQIGAYNVASQAQSLVTANQTVVNQAIAQGLIPSTASVIQIAEYLIASGVATSTLLSNTLGIFGGGLTSTGVYATGGATLNFALNTSEARALDQIQLRVGDRQPGSFRVGSRYPITTATYTTGAAATSSSLAGITINGVSASSLLAQYAGGISSATVPQIQYEDLGLTLKATPTITKLGAVHLKLDLKIEAIAGGAIDNIPILANRQIVSEITVQDGETAMVLSNLNRSESRAINGVPGLSELPGFQSATDQTAEADSSQLVLLLTPHIVRRRANTLAGPRIPFTPPGAIASN